MKIRPRNFLVHIPITYLFTYCFQSWVRLTDRPARKGNWKFFLKLNLGIFSKLNFLKLNETEFSEAEFMYIHRPITYCLQLHLHIYLLFSVMGTIDGQACKERKLDAVEYPAAVQSLWPKTLPTTADDTTVLTEYRFVIRLVHLFLDVFIQVHT